MSSLKKRPASATPKAPTSQRSLVILATLLIAGFFVAIFLQFAAQERMSSGLVLAERESAANLAAAEANAAMAQSWGALAGAAGLANARGLHTADPASAVAAAARARPVEGVVLLDGRGGVVASTKAGLAPVAAASWPQVRGKETWAGGVQAGAKTHPVIARMAGGQHFISVIDPQRIMRPAAPGELLLLIDSNDRVLHASDAAVAGQTLDQVVSLRGQRRGASFIGVTAAGQSVAVGRGPVVTGDLSVVSIMKTRSPVENWLRSLLMSSALAATPLLAVGMLLILMRKNVERAQVAEREIQRVEARFKMTADGAKAGTFEWSPAQDRLHLSEQLAAILKSSATDISLGQLLQLAPPEDRTSIEQAFQNARESGALDIGFRILAAHSFNWIELRGVAFEDDRGATHQRFFGTGIDVSARREAELRAAALQRRLREAIDSFTGPFALWDSRRRLIMWNRSYSGLFELAPNVLRTGASYETVSLACAPAIVRDRTDANDSQIREIELKSGVWLQMQERRTAEGGLLTVGLDITQIKKQEEALKRNDQTLRAAVTKLERSEGRNKELARSFEEQKRRAEDASRAKSAFLANMSHELRTPLNAIIGFSEIMSQSLFGPLGDARYQSYAKDILSSGQLLLDLINDVLDMAKIEAGKFNLLPKALDPQDAIDQAVRLVRRRAEEKGLQLIVDAPELPEIEADHRAVKQMLLNVLTNAVKFTEKGGVMLECRETGMGIQFRIVDTGRGIPRDQLPRLARPFEQVDNELARDHPGTGLGLALTKSLAEMHGGRLEIDSQEGRGTVVTIMLPRVFGAGEEPLAAE